MGVYKAVAICYNAISVYWEGVNMAITNYMNRPLMILEFLKAQTTPDRRMSAVEIVRELKVQRNIDIDRRTVKSIIDDLIAAGYPIGDDAKYYYKGYLSRGEAQYLMSAIKYGSGLTDEQRSSLAGKIADLCTYDIDVPQERYRKPENPDMLNTLDVIRQAMDQGMQIAFRYGNYDTDGILHPRLNRRNSIKEYKASPYFIAFANGKYYLIATVNKHKEYSHYRIDRIMDVHIRRSRIPENAHKTDVDEYIVEHPYMYSGEVQTYRIRVRRSMLNDVYDWFGTDVFFENEDPDEVDAIIQSDPASMKFWLLRYGSGASIIQIE